MNNLVNHLFLPRQLPQSLSPDENDSQLLALVTEQVQVVYNSVSQIKPLPPIATGLAEVLRMMVDWRQLQSTNETDALMLNEQLKALNDGQALALYVKYHNAGVLVKRTRPEDEYKAAVSSFQASAVSQDVMSTKGDVGAWFPGATVNVRDLGLLQSAAFSEQLCEFANCACDESAAHTTKAGRSFEEVREVASPVLVRDWLLAVLAADSRPASVHRVAKKIRDDVLWDNSLLPFRRSALWMTVRVMLQLRLTELLGDNEGKVLYKWIVLNLLVTVFKQQPLECADLCMQMLSKLAKRCYKLQQLNASSVMGDLIGESVEATCMLIERTRDNLDRLWSSVVEQSRSVEAVIDSERIRSDDCRHLLPSSYDKIKQYLFDESRITTAPCLTPTSSRRSQLDCSGPDTSLLTTTDDQLPFALYDIEVWISRYSGSYLAPADLYKLLENYLPKASACYKDDPLGFSRMVLSAGHLCKLLDERAMAECPLLKEHSFGIDVGVFEHVLLPKSEDLEMLSVLIVYIQSRDKIAKYGPIIDDGPIGSDSFSVRYAQSNNGMQNVKSAILNNAKSMQNAKMDELKQARSEYGKLSRERDQLQCICYQWNRGWYKCDQCRLSRKMTNMYISVYEWPLPKDDNLCDAVIFELCIPSTFSLLRDALHLFKTYIYCSLAEQSKPIKGLWRERCDLQNWITPCTSLLTLGSDLISIEESHYNRHHVSSADEQFVSANAYNVLLTTTNGSQQKQKAQQKTTFNALSTTTNGSEPSQRIQYKTNVNRLIDSCSLKTKGNYQMLQWTVRSTSHTENEVLARQSTCAASISLKEFVTFGFLRAGHRLQLCNLLDAINSRTLSFGQSSVYNLVCQTLWQVGPFDSSPPSAGEPWTPDSHADMTKGGFLRQLHDVLLTMLSDYEHSWQQHRVLLVIVAISSRALSLAPHSEVTLWRELLLKCRAVANQWANSVEQVINEIGASNLQSVQALRSKLIDIASCSILTFCIDQRNILLDCNSAVQWLRSCARINENVTDAESCATFQRNLLREVRRSILLMEKPFLHVVLECNSVCLSEFVESSWSDAATGQLGPWTQYERPLHCWFRSTFTTKRNKQLLLQISQCGEFLVQGQPLGRLPCFITASADFKRVFENMVFEVQPSSYGVAVFVTRYGYQNAKYRFTIHNECLIVQQQVGNEIKYLLPHSIFIHDLPDIFVHNYSHWYDPSSEMVCFKPKSFKDSKFVTRTDYILDLKERLLYSETMGQLIDINSNSFNELYAKITNRLELKQYTHMWHSPKKEWYIDFPRMGLQFELVGSAVKSREYRGMEVSVSQKLGTLIGLEKGLLLCDENDHSRKQLLVPHGTLVATKRHKGAIHPHVDINVEILRSPAVLVYHIDSRLRELKAEPSDAAWLYLAWLHGMTASVLPDPFLGLTGTEKALQLLQSGRCWSCRPYDDESLSTLDGVRSLSPVRRFYPPHLQRMQTVKWPDSLTPSVAHDAFSLVVHKLLEDSQRLAFAFGTETSLSWVTSLNNAAAQKSLLLAERAYWRNSCGLTGICKQLESCLGAPSVKHIQAKIILHLSNVRKISRCFSQSVPCQSTVSDVYKFLAAQNPADTVLVGAPFEHRLQTVQDWLHLYGQGAEEIVKRKQRVEDQWSTVFKKYWIPLYVLACQANTRNEQAKIILSLAFLSYKQVDTDQLLQLVMIMQNREQFSQTIVPKYSAFHAIESNNYCKVSVTNIVEKHGIGVRSHFNRQTIRMGSATVNEFYTRTETAYKHELQSAAANINDLLFSNWLKGLFEVSQSDIRGEVIDEVAAHQELSVTIKLWAQNHKLKEFLNSVSSTLKIIWPNAQCKHQIIQATEVFQKLLPNYERTCFELNIVDAVLTDEQKQQACEALSCYKSDRPAENICANRITEHSRPTDEFNKLLHHNNTHNSQLEALLVARTLRKDLEKSWLLFCNNDSSGAQSVLQTCTDKYYAEAAKLWQTLIDVLQPAKTDYVKRALFAAALWPRLTPTTLLPLLCSQSNHVADSVKHLLGVVAVLWTLDQRSIRLSRSTDQSPLQRQHDLSHAAHYNWSPYERPEWLLLELEMNKMIRPVQVDVANQMMSPDGNRNSVMQLNMGEGKTSVILPIVAAALADGSKLVRITVLRSLQRLCYNSLKYLLGGLLNRRVFIFPCSRDIAFTEQQIDLFHSVQEECMQSRGVWLALPEHRLSFKLKGLENCLSKNGAKAKRLLEAQKWIDQHTRDILDESDEILHVKYQLVYSVGHNVTVDGESLRWLACEQILRAASIHLEKMRSRAETAKSIEYHKDEEMPQSFPRIRLLREDVYAELCEAICKEIFAGQHRPILSLPELTANQLTVIMDYVLKATDCEVAYKEVLKLFANESPMLNVIWLMRGVLSFEVLYLVLNRRWRVNYGVSPSGRRLMAVPFRAKDVAAERAEFGHPDVAILFTQLSYYYSGLSDTQCEEAWKQLQKHPTPSEEYQRWIQVSPASFPPSLSEYVAVNLHDQKQKERLFSVLRRHVDFISFWLDSVVFPKEAKTYDKKLATSAWDLSEVKQHPTTGFSGTNECHLLLPATITQNNLSKLEQTNGYQLVCMLHEDNNSYLSLPENACGRDIIEQLSHREDIRVLLDVGALMLDLDNQQVADRWLSLSAERVQAAVFFSDDDELVVITRSKRHKPERFNLSPYQSCLDRCVIYLDEAHTRGTDLQLPVGFKGCVTLGTGVTKDRLIQACMRMRLLGQGHSVCFWASKEVDYVLTSNCSGAVIGSTDVLRWALNNTTKLITDGFLYWAEAGLYYARKSIAFRLFEHADQLETLGMMCTEAETTNLQQLYGGERKMQYIVDTIQQELRHHSASLKTMQLDYQVNMLSEESVSQIVTHCTQYASDIKGLSQLLTEEQEKELEFELQDEREVYRPDMAKPQCPTLESGLMQIVQTGILKERPSFLIPLVQCLQGTSLWSIAQPLVWHQDLLATSEFAETIQRGLAGERYDSFLRPPRWIAMISVPGGSTLLALSAFETNALRPSFNSSVVSLHLYSPTLRLHQANLFEYDVNSWSTVKHLFDDRCHELITQLCVFAGSPLFQSTDEQQRFMDFLGFCAAPRLAEEQKLFDEGIINNDGFVPIDNRHLFKRNNLARVCKFKHNPSEFIGKLYEMRNYFNVSKLSHHLQILRGGVKPLAEESKQSVQLLEEHSEKH